jgi:hypothetical protein
VDGLALLGMDVGFELEGTEVVGVELVGLELEGILVGATRLDSLLCTASSSTSERYRSYVYSPTIFPVK